MEVLWKKCLEEIEKKVLPENYNAWFTPTYPSNLEGDFLTITVPDDCFKQCLQDNYQDLIETTLESISQTKMRVQFQIKAPQKMNGFESPAAETKEHPEKGNGISIVQRNGDHSTLNPKHTFNSFVVGSSNQFAHAAGLAVATNPGTAYNPLFIYGAVGLGKTHLLHAIGNTIRENNPDARVRYLSAESFTVDLIQSLRKDEMVSFRKRYRPLDVLLVDDIQFIIGKERTQEEFFYTFNSLYESHKQVVLSSDRYPREMQKIEERLRSRFESGLIADIDPPDLETKIAILFKKAEQHQKDIPDDVANFIASNIKSNIRELEGFLLRIIAFSSFTRRDIDLELAQEVLKEFTLDKNRNFTIPIILKAVASFHGLKVADLKSTKRSRNISLPRQIAMYLSREFTQSSLPDIGRQFGGKDHTTVLFAHKKITGKVKENSELRKTIQNIIELIETS